MKIVVDTGHCLSGADTGAQGNGYREEVCTREIGNKVISKLRALGHTVILVSTDYASTLRASLNSRVSSANAAKADISVSIHLNAGGGRGVEIYTKSAVEFTEVKNILNNLVAIGYVNRGIKDGSDLALVGSIWTKSMLVECGFIDSASDMKLYNSEKIADCIVTGLVGKTTASPSNPAPSRPVTGNKYLNLSPSVQTWRVYPLNKAAVVGNEVGKLAPAQFGGLSYEILGNPSTDIYTIKTVTFGTVNIYAPRDNDSSITSAPVY